MCGWWEKQKRLEDRALFCLGDTWWHNKFLDRLDIDDDFIWISTGRRGVSKNRWHETDKNDVGSCKCWRPPSLPGEAKDALAEAVDNLSKKNSAVKHPDYYNWHPVAECIEIIAEFPWCRGEAMKYIWRAGRKDEDKEIEDLEKAVECLQAEIRRLSDE